MSCSRLVNRELTTLQTPCLLLDEARMMRNVVRLRTRLQGFGVSFRPHLKTTKCAEVAARLMDSPSGPVAVSTLKEAEQFAAVGVRDMLYAVGIAPAKLDRAAALRRSGVDLSLVLDSTEQARVLTSKSKQIGISFAVLIEIDCDGHRSGVRPGDPALIEIGRILHDGGAMLRGVMTHGGASYDEPGEAAVVRAAQRERDAAVQCAEALRAAGLPCPVVSVGSTPTAHFARQLTGVTEVRAGVFVFFDLVMAGLGICGVDDIAISVLATVIGHQRDKEWIIVDAGWMAMSRDRGTAKQLVDQAYGLVCDMEGRPYQDILLKQTNQEHGIICARDGARGRIPALPVGSLVRVLPNHACATAAQHDRYWVLNQENQIVASWPRFSGW